MRRLVRGFVAGVAAVVLWPAVAGAVPLAQYAPVGAWNGDTVLMVHGGAWGAGGQDVYRANGTVAALNGSGYRVVVMDYADLDLPRQVSQVAGVARALDRKARRVVVWGDSAGGLLALEAASRTPAIAAVVAVSAPSDLRTLPGQYVPQEHVSAVLRGAGAWRYSPLRAARAGLLTAPVLLVAHRGDPVVSFTGQTVPLYRSLKARGVRAVLKPMPGAVHEYVPSAVGAATKFLSTNDKDPRASTSRRSR